MKEIKCPNCGEVFTVDEAGYAAIVRQVRDSEFQKELDGYRTQLEKEKDSSVQLALHQATLEHLDELKKKDEAFQKVASELKSYQEAREQEILTSDAIHQSSLEALKARYEKMLLEQENQSSSSLKDRDAAILTLQEKLSRSEEAKGVAIQSALNEKEKEVAALKLKLQELEGRLSSSLQEKQLALAESKASFQEVLSKKDLEISEIRSKAEQEKNTNLIALGNMKSLYEAKLGEKDELIAYYKDFKTKLSTKMVGESLEVYCHNEFNKIRSVAFPRAYFEKDNDARTGSKGDFIYRDYSEDGTEYLSIMFEMKNENDATTTKHKNEHFFKELDKDRNEKGCEYAVLVSMLEADNDYYNNGIVEVYGYPKMFVVRPAFFLPLISILKNASLGSLEYKRELALEKQRNIDVTNFESALNDFKDGFSRNYRLASDKFKKAIDEIDTSISHLQKVRDSLLASENNLRLANNKAEDLTIKKLTKNNATMTALFKEVETK